MLAILTSDSGILLPLGSHIFNMVMAYSHNLFLMGQSIMKWGIVSERLHHLQLADGIVWAENRCCRTTLVGILLCMSFHQIILALWSMGADHSLSQSEPEDMMVCWTICFAVTCRSSTSLISVIGWPHIVAFEMYSERSRLPKMFSIRGQFGICNEDIQLQRF